MKAIQEKIQRKINRRDFLKIVAISGVAAGLGGNQIIKLLADNEILSFSETRLLMGTVINLTVVSDDRTHLAEISRADIHRNRTADCGL